MIMDIISLANAKSLVKINFGHKIFCLPLNKLYIIPENSLSKVKNSTLVGGTILSNICKSI